jgi:hypothetical protein
LIDVVLQLLPIAYFVFSSPTFAENGLNGPLVQAAFYLFIIWKISETGNCRSAKNDELSLGFSSENSNVRA